MKLVSLNLRFGGQDRTDSILDYLMDHDADLLVLGEFQDNKNGLKIKETLKKEGFTCITSDDDLLGVLVASKYPFSLIMRERRLVGIELSDSMLTVLGVYVPTGSKDKRFKDAVWQKILKFALENRNTPCIITGDFNSCTKNDSMNRSHYSADELEKLINIGWIDGWANYNDNDSERYTWYSDYGNGFRFDYVFISPGLAKNIDLKKVYHDSKKREEGMSDHSPLIMEYSF
jgi:exonuclease III